MAMRQNEDGTWYDDGTGVVNPGPPIPMSTAADAPGSPVPLVNPMTGAPIAGLEPDTVGPNDLLVGHAPAAFRGKAGSTSAPVTADLPATSYPPQTAPFPIAGEAAGAGDETPAPPPAPASKAPAAGGGGGGGLPLGPTKDQVLARGEALTADEQERDVINSKVGLEQSKANAQVAQDVAEAKREKALQDAQKQAIDKATADLQSKEDTLAKDKIHDQFEGKPLTAVLVALGAGLGAYAATRTGGVNHAQAILDRSADMFRQKELHRLEQENRNVAGAKENRAHIEAQADVATAALYRSFARERETVLRRFGADDAKVQGDALLQQNLARAAERNQTWANNVATTTREELNARATRAAAYASAGHANAETKKTLAEAAQIDAGNGPGSAAGGRAAGIQIQKATLAEHGASALKTIDELIAKGVDLTEKDRQKIQDNLKDMQGADHMNPVMAKLGRSTVLARSPYEGLSPEKQKLAQAYEILAQKGAGLVSPSHAEDEMKHARSLFDLGVPGENQDIRRRKLDQAREVVGAARALGGKYSGIAQQGADAERAGAPAQAKPAPLTPYQKVKTQEWLKANPKDPRAAAARARLLE